MPQLTLFNSASQSSPGGGSGACSGYSYKSTKWTSAGGVVLRGLQKDEIDYIWIVKPSGYYGPICFPKGRVEEGQSLEEAALREVLEESGILAKFLPGGYLGQGEGMSSTTHYYMMVQVGGSEIDHDFETEESRLLHIDDLIKQLSMSTNTRDERIARAAKEYINDLKDRMGYL